MRRIRSREGFVGFLILVSAAQFFLMRSASAQSGIVTSGFIFGMPDPPPGLTYVEIAAESDGVIARLSDGSLVDCCSNVGPDLPSGLTYVEVDFGRYHVIARRSDGSVVAWGDNWKHQCDVPALPPGLTYVEISAGAWHSLARRSDGSVVAWGVNVYGECDVPALPPGLTYVEVSAGGEDFNLGGHSVARRSDGSIVAWGDNFYGQCNVPALPPGLTYVEISAGSWFTAARRSDGSIVAWGNNFYGQCNVPPPPPGRTYMDVEAGGWHIVARLNDGSVAGWGWNEFGQCDLPPLMSNLAYVEIAASSAGTAARYAGCSTCERPFCAGDGGEGSVPCPCGNNGAAHRGCENSASTGGAKLTVRGSIDPDQVVLSTTGELPSAPSIFFQGSSVLENAVVFGDGVRCIGGALKRLGVKSAVAGAATYPGPGDSPIRARSAMLGDPILPGSFRYYQVYYRDGNPSFCNPPPAKFNASNAVLVAW